MFRKLTLRLGWVKNGKRPRLHDLRHSFACRVLFKWRCRKTGQEDRIDWLSHYLGHERVSDTYWYFPLLQSSWPPRRGDLNLRLKNSLLDEYARTIR